MFISIYKLYHNSYTIYKKRISRSSQETTHFCQLSFAKNEIHHFNSSLDHKNWTKIYQLYLCHWDVFPSDFCELPIEKLTDRSLQHAWVRQVPTPGQVQPQECHLKPKMVPNKTPSWIISLGGCLKIRSSIFLAFLLKSTISGWVLWVPNLKTRPFEDSLFQYDPIGNELKDFGALKRSSVSKLSGSRYK